MTTLAVVFRLLLLGLCSLVLVPLQMLALSLGWSATLHVLPVWFHRALLKIFNVRVIERGTPPGRGKSSAAGEVGRAGCYFTTVTSTSTVKVSNRLFTSNSVAAACTPCRAIHS